MRSSRICTYGVKISVFNVFFFLEFNLGFIQKTNKRIEFSFSMFSLIFQRNLINLGYFVEYQQESSFFQFFFSGRNIFNKEKNLILYSKKRNIFQG